MPGIGEEVVAIGVLTVAYEIHRYRNAEGIGIQERELCIKGEYGGGGGGMMEYNLVFICFF